MMKILYFFLIFILLSSPVAAQQEATVKKYNKLFVTYPYSDPNPIPETSQLYPYFRYEGFTNKKEQKSWKVIELKNEYITVTILPEIGGKIWSATENKSGRSFIYNNHVIKFRDVAMRGPWTSGGLEANFGIMGHTPNCSTPVDYMTRVNSDGSASCIIGALDLLTQTQWRIEINLEKDKGYFTTKTFWYNPSPLPQPYYQWMNLGIKSSGNLEFIFPGTHYIGHNGETMPWPVDKKHGKQINFYEQNNYGGPKSYHVLGRLTNHFGAYYHSEDNGIVHYSQYSDKPGKKIWIWGLSEQGMIWRKLLTDTDEQYVEIQSGRFFNQNSVQSGRTPFKHTDFAPFASNRWTEYWYPVSGIKGFVQANQQGALNYSFANNQLKIYLSAASLINDSLKISSKGRIVYNKKVKLKPLQIFADSIPMSSKEDLHFVLGDNQLIYDTRDDSLSRPLTPPENFDWTTAYGEYIQGRELLNQRLYREAGIHLKRSIEKDNNFLPALVKMATLAYRDMLYDKALSNIKKALQIDTYDGEANYYYGLINEKLGNINDAKDGFSIAALTQSYRSAAYTSLARIGLKEKNYDLSIQYSDKALDYNHYNVAARMIKAVASRKQKKQHEADNEIKKIQLMDALSHFARFERYYTNKNPATATEFTSLIANELPSQTFLELAIWYYNAGCEEEAKTILQLSPETAETRYWLAFLKKKQFILESNDPYLSFPFRSETAEVLEQLLKEQDSWFLKYQLALIYKDRNRMEDCKRLLISCDSAPDYAPFYAFRAKIFIDQELKQRKDLLKAVSLDKDQWRYQKLLAEHYLKYDQPEAAISLTKQYYTKHPNNYIMGTSYVKALLHDKKYGQADKILDHLNILPSEGATEGRILYRKTKLALAILALGNNKFKQATRYIDDARRWPTHLGEGKPYDSQNDDRLENWMEYLIGRRQNEGLLDKIIEFIPGAEGTNTNFYPSNALISAWAIEAKAGKAKALKWLDRQAQAFPSMTKAIQGYKKLIESNSSNLIPGRKYTEKVLWEILLNEKKEMNNP